MEGAKGAFDFEHVFALLLEDAGSLFEVLGLQEFGDGEGFRFWGAGLDGDLLAWLCALLMLVLVLATLCLLLLRLLLSHLVLLHCLRFQFLDVLGYCHAGLLRFGSELGLHLADLFWGWLLAGLHLHWWRPALRWWLCHIS